MAQLKAIPALGGAACHALQVSCLSDRRLLRDADIVHGLVAWRTPVCRGIWHTGQKPQTRHGKRHSGDSSLPHDKPRLGRRCWYSTPERTAFYASLLTQLLCQSWSGDPRGRRTMGAASQTLQWVRKDLHGCCGKVPEHDKRPSGDFPWGFAHVGQIPTNNSVYHCACAKFRLYSLLALYHIYS